MPLGHRPPGGSEAGLLDPLPSLPPLAGEGTGEGDTTPLSPEAALTRHDSLTALEKAPGALLRTGVTGTNVGDLAIYLRRACVE